MRIQTYRQFSTFVDKDTEVDVNRGFRLRQIYEELLTKSVLDAAIRVEQLEFELNAAKGLNPN